MRAHCFVLLLLSIFSLLSAVHAAPVKRQTTSGGSVASTALVIAISTDAADEAVSTLNQFNQPTQVLVIPQNGTDLPSLETTSGSVTVGNFALIIVIGLASYDYSTGWASAITTDQWDTLYAYQLTYGVRMIHLDGFPGNFPGTAVAYNAAGGCCVSDIEQVVTVLDTTLAPSGTAPVLSTIGLWHYPATITNFTTTSSFLLFEANQIYNTNTVAGVIQNFGGREQMVFFLDGASWSATTNYLGELWYNWGYGFVTTVSISPTALVIATDADAAAEPIFTLNQYNQTYQLLAIPQNGTDLPALTSTNGANVTVANYGLIIIVSLVSYDYGGTTGWQSAITTDQWEALYSYQSLYGIYMIHLDGYPDNFLGTTTAPNGPIGCCSSDEQLVSVVDTSLLTLAGLSPANLSTLGLWHYPAAITDATTTTAFIDFAPNAEYNTTTVAGVLQNLGGRQQMVLFLPGASWSSTTAYLGSIWYSWGYQGLSPTTTTTSNPSSESSVVAAARSSALADPLSAFAMVADSACVANGFFANFTTDTVTPDPWCAGVCRNILQNEYTYTLVSTPDCVSFLRAEIALATAPDAEFMCLLYYPVVITAKQ